MKYEHNFVMTAELSETIVTDHSDDLSERFANAMKKLIGTVVDNVNVVRCQDFIREKNEEEDQDDWIRFDPDDKRTWPEMEDEISGKTVLACDDEGHIYIAYLMNVISEDPMWSLTNESEDLEVQARCVVAWRPLPNPFHI